MCETSSVQKMEEYTRVLLAAAVSKRSTLYKLLSVSTDENEDTMNDAVL